MGFWTFFLLAKRKAKSFNFKQMANDAEWSPRVWKQKSKQARQANIKVVFIFKSLANRILLAWFRSFSARSFRPKSSYCT